MKRKAELIKEYNRINKYYHGMSWREDTTEIIQALSELKEQIIGVCSPEEYEIAKLFLEIK